MPHATHTIPLASRTLTLGPIPLIMGILNVTPDSFSDGGDFAGHQAAQDHATALLAAGVDIIDIGGESTRPGANPVPVQAELDRVMPVIDAIAGTLPDAVVSIDTYKALVADQAIQAGAHIINDVHGLQRDPDMAAVAALHGTPVVIMHWDVERDTNRDLIDEVRRYFDRSLDIAAKAGIASGKIVLDPGFGFGKGMADNYTLLRRLGELTVLGYPLLAGTSRKSMIGRLLGTDPKDRLAGSMASTVLAYGAGAHLFRVHDVAPTRQALRIAQATLYGPDTVPA